MMQSIALIHFINQIPKKNTKKFSRLISWVISSKCMTTYSLPISFEYLTRIGGHERTTLENFSGIYIIFFRFIERQK